MKKRYPIDLEAVGGRLRAVRDELKLSMEQMREISGYSKSLISAAENGLKKPSVLYLYALYHRYNVNIHYIFSGEGDMFLGSRADSGAPDMVPEPETADGGRDAPSFDWVGEDPNLRSLFHLMENVDMVRFAVLSHFIEYRTQHKQLIEELMEEKREQMDREKEQDEPADQV